MSRAVTRNYDKAARGQQTDLAELTVSHLAGQPSTEHSDHLEEPDSLDRGESEDNNERLAPHSAGHSSHYLVMENILILPLILITGRFV